MYNINRIHEDSPSTSSFDTRPANVGRGESPVSFLFIPPFFIRRGAMPRHMPRPAHEPRGVNKIHGLVVAVETETADSYHHFISGSRERPANRSSRHSFYFTLFLCPGNRATCPCSSLGRAGRKAKGLVRFQARANSFGL